MSWVMVSPELVVAAAADLAGIGSAISSANAAAAVNTTGLLTAGADEVSTAIAALFGAQGQAYQAASAQAAAFYAQFVQALSAGGGAYAAAEAAAVSPLLAPINAQFVAATGRPLIGNGANGAPGTGANGGPRVVDRHGARRSGRPRRLGRTVSGGRRAVRQRRGTELCERIPAMARCDVLVSADWAESNLHAPKVVFVEVDEDTSAYDRDHIAGAIKLDWRTDLQDPVKRDFVDAQQFSKLLSERGIANEDTVILYGGNNNWFAAYAYWYFKLYGHEKVKLLDGGRKKWELDGRPLSSDPVSRPVTSYTASPPDNTIRAFRDEVLAAINVKNLIDVRSPDEFSGKILAPAHLPQEQSQRPGHIPGAINVPWSRAANEDGTFKSDEELAKLYADAGLDNSKETIAYCRIGERSSHTWFVLRELLGHQNVKNYDGSWTEYGSLVGAPIELGS